MNGILVSVEYDDLLAITLPRNARHFGKVLVITTPADEATQAVAAAVPNAALHITDAFYRHGAAFNKGAAIEEGFDVIGREGWLVVFDADVIMPETLDLPALSPGKLYSPHRRMCSKPTKWSAQADWRGFPLRKDLEHAGYFQLFHAADPVLKSRPWYSVNWRHAGGCDSEFQAKWSRQDRVWLPFEVLHLGDDEKNWFGRCTARLDGTIPLQANARCKAMRQMYTLRHRHGFKHEKLTSELPEKDTSQ